MPKHAGDYEACASSDTFRCALGTEICGYCGQDVNKQFVPEAHMRAVARDEISGLLNRVELLETKTDDLLNQHIERSVEAIASDRKRAYWHGILKHLTTQDLLDELQSRYNDG